MNSSRRAELLIYLFFRTPYAVLFQERKSGIRRWVGKVLHTLPMGLRWRDGEIEEIAEQFVELVARLRPPGTGDAEDRFFHFLASPEFSVAPQTAGDLRAERERLLSELRHLDRELGLPTGSYQRDLRPEPASLVARTEPVRHAIYGSLTSFLREAGPGALGNDAIARLLTRDTGA